MKTGKKRKGALLAIDLGSHSVKFAVGQAVGDRLKVTSMFMRELPDGVYANGEIKDYLALKTAIMSAVKDNHVKIKDVVVTVECTEIIKREMIINQVPDEDKLDLIAYEVSQYLPIDVSSYVLQFKELETIKEEETLKVKILLGAMPKDIVKAHFELINECGLNPCYMDMHSNSLEKLVKVCHFNEPRNMNHTAAYIDFGHKIIDISIFEDFDFKFNRLLKLGSAEFNRVLMEYLSVEADEAESRKKKTSVTGLIKAYAAHGTDEPAKDKETELKNLVLRDTVNYLEEVIDEIDKVFKYYTSRNAENKIDQVYIYGGSAQFTDLIELFSERFELPVKIVKTINNLDYAGRTEVERTNIYINALGALIRG